MSEQNHIKQIAILIPTNTEWGKNVTRGILSYASNTGPWRILAKPGISDQLSVLTKGWKVDGIIALVGKESLAQEITQSGLPVVNVCDTKVADFSAPCVRTNDDVTTQLAIDHFLERGFRHIAYVGGLKNASMIWFAERLEKKAVENGMTFAAYSDHVDEPELSDQLTQWLHHLPKPCGILTWGHGAARQIIDCCQEYRIPVPHDISVLSGHYDDLFCRTCFPPLSGIQAPTKQIGYHAAYLLDEIMHGKDVPHENTFIPPQDIRENLSTDTLAIEDPQLVQVVKYIRTHAFVEINMADILKAVPMARRSLDRRFAKAFGRTPMEEVRRLRINKARQLLADSDLPIQQIAEACGFSSYNYLSLFFKKMTGMSPRVYRNKFRAF